MSPSSSKRSDLNDVVPSVGLSVLVDPEHPLFDVVFVHGFTGHPVRTWTHSKGDAIESNQGDISHQPVEPPLKARKKYFQSSGPQQSIYWPRDFLPQTIPNARVLTYGYDTNIRHILGAPTSKHTVYDIGRNFLVSLEAERRSEPSRPVLFIAHSLGGIIVKEMLRRASRAQEHQQSIFNSTIGVFFFGTPHSGADPLGYAQRIIENIGKAVGFTVNKQIVDTLLPSSERLRELREEFGPMAQDEDWIIHSFQEQLGIRALGDRKVVDDTSSCLHLPKVETSEHIGRNHMDMCRFSGLHDMEYKKVSAALLRILSVASRKPRRGETLTISEERKCSLLESLGFDQIDSRHLTIKKVAGKTCKWLLKTSEYMDWLDYTKQPEHHGFLWIKGKAGTGKSTLMKFALADAQKVMRKRIILSFFFNARGDDLEKSTIGMYRSLLLQILEQAPELQHILGRVRWSAAGNAQWSIELLEELFEQAIEGLRERSIACFIDALDECSEREIRRMITFFESMGELAMSSQIQFSICFSSRHYPEVTISKGLTMILEGHEGHSQDITDYVDSKLKIGHGKVAEGVRSELREKASGVFMWVVLVVDILNKEHESGQVHRLRRRLQDLPPGLPELFRDILTRDSHDRNQLLLCVQWVLFAHHPLTPKELYFAILSGIETEELSSIHSDETTEEDIRRFILHSSKGLAEITKSKSPTVQFIHESVRDFFFKENGVNAIWEDFEDSFLGQSHETLKQCCLRYMSIDTGTHFDPSKPLPKASLPDAMNLRKSVTESFPFLEYAVHHVLYHANAAEGSGVTQQEFLEGFQLAKWIELDNLFEKHEIRRHTTQASLLYILAEKNMSSLIRIHPRNLFYLDIEDERYGVPLFAALATGSYEAFITLMEVEMENHAKSTLLDEVYNRLCQGRGSWSSFGRDFKFSRRKNIFSFLEDPKDETVLLSLLVTGKVDAESKSTSGQTLLFWAAEQGCEAMVKLLLAMGQDVKSKDTQGRTPLFWAVIGHREAVVRLLLATGQVDVEAKDTQGRTPLSWATERGQEAVVQLLLEAKADAEAKDHYGRTPLLWAAMGGHEDVVKLLLATGQVDVEAKSISGQTPLSWAAGGGHEAVVKLLHEAKANIQAKDPQ